MAKLSGSVVPASSYLGVLVVAVQGGGVAIGGALLGQVVIAPACISSISRLLGGFGGYALLNLIYLLIGFLPVYVGLAALAALRDRRSPVVLLARGDGWPIGVAVGAAVGTALILGPVALNAVRGGCSVQLVSPAGGAPALALAIVFGLVAVAYQSFAEELVFRGWLQPAVAPKIGWGPAVGLTALLFAASHSVNASFDVALFFGLTAMGVVFGLLARWTDSVWAAGVAHTALNFWGMQAVSWGGQPSPAGFLVVVPPDGEQLFGGRAVVACPEYFGLSVVIVAALAITIRQRRTAPAAGAESRHAEPGAAADPAS